jgi:hypothetical protein
VAKDEVLPAQSIRDFFHFLDLDMQISGCNEKAPWDCSEGAGGGPELKPPRADLDAVELVHGVTALTAAKWDGSESTNEAG